jgi:hypothetical protein
MIKGITATEDGIPIQRLSVSTKVAIGLPPSTIEGRKAPVKLDHFVFLRKSSAAQNAWEVDPDLTKVYGTKCREFEVVLLDDDIENVFPTKLAWFTASECKCFGNGDVATRRTAEHPDGQPWTPCGKSCPDFERGDCKPSGDLRFMLAAFPKLGSVARIHTGSYRSIMQISSSIQQIQTITGGRLAGIRAKLVVRPEKTSYMSEKDNKRHSTTIYALNLEIQAAGISELIGRMTDHARLFEQTRKMLGTGRIEVVEDDNERAEEIAPEFYPAANIAPVTFPKPDETEEIVEPKKQPNMDVKCGNCGGVNGHEPDCKYAAKAEQDRLTSKPTNHRAYSLIGVEKKTINKKTMLQLEVLTNEGKGYLCIWHKSLHKYFEQRGEIKPALAMRAEVSEHEKNGKLFVHVEHLLELGGQVFVDDSPAEQGVVEADPLDGESLFGASE